MTETDALRVLNAVPGLGRVGIRKLLAGCGSAVAVLDRDAEQLVRRTGIPPEAAEAIRRLDAVRFLAAEQELLTAAQVRVMSFQDPDFPPLLREIPDAPLLLYIRGQILPADELAVAIVGSRRASPYGRSVAERFAARLAGLGITVVSGLARGIDTAAHQGCLRAHGRTLAVLGCGLSCVYPPENKDLFARVAANGAVISEFPMAAEPRPFFFPMRNRIISGLSLGVLVVEAAKNSGALITSRLALEQGREVFAVPGNLDQTTAWGTNDLIRQGARLVSGVEDILEELTPRLRANQPVAGLFNDPGQEKIENTLSDPEGQVYNHISRRPVALDDLVLSCERSAGELSGILLSLEMKGLVRSLPGRSFVRP